MAKVCKTNTDVCENVYDENGNPINGNGTDENGNSCVPSNSGTGADSCPTSGGGDTCKPWQLTMTRDNCIIDDFVEESINIASADVNVFKLLGVHEQKKLIDLTENGNAISGGDHAGFPKEEAFTTFVTEWRSVQKGPAVLTSAFIGYDFGIIRLENKRRRYGAETHIKHNISSIKIKQSNNVKNRITKARVERSEDGIKWYGAAIITLPDDNCLNTIHFRSTAPMRYWRIRPLEFNGAATDYWGVQALEMFDFELTRISNIQDKIWHENRDRDYAEESIRIKAYYDLLDVTSEMARFGIELTGQVLQFQVSFNASVAALGRPIVIGDIFEVPSEQQYNTNLEPIKKYMEVTDVAWASNGYAPNWVPLIQRITTQPMWASQETADIFGGLEGYEDDTGFFENFAETHGMDDGDHPVYQDYSDVDHTIDQTADDQSHLPERGRDPADITQFSEAQLEAAESQGIRQSIEKIGLNPKQLYVEDAMPPNGLPFTEGDTLPPSPNDGDYHRLTYTGIDASIPARLFRYSLAKNRWVFMESDKRAKYKETKPVLQEFLGSATRKPSDEIAK